MSAYREGICDLWCKKAFLKNTQNQHVGLKCGHVRFMVQKGVLKNTQNRHVGLKCEHVSFMVKKGVFKNHYKR